MDGGLVLSIVAVALAVALAVGALAVAWMAVTAGRRSRARFESIEASFVAMRRELELVASISVRTGRRVQRVERAYSNVAERIDTVESQGPGSGALTGPGSETLDQAIDWARRGADPDRLAEHFGLSSGEAELVTRLHGRSKSA
jgi:hypothetical protein